MVLFRMSNILDILPFEVCLSSLLYYIIRVAALPLPLPETALRLALKVRLFGGMADLGIPGVFSTMGQNRQQLRPCGTSTPQTQP